jgi:hypothetical protein
MRLKLSIWAEDLVRSAGGTGSAGAAPPSAKQQMPPNPYGVISILSPQPGTPPRVLGTLIRRFLSAVELLRRVPSST